MPLIKELKISECTKVKDSTKLIKDMMLKVFVLILVHHTHAESLKRVKVRSVVVLQLSLSAVFENGFQ